MNSSRRVFWRWSFGLTWLAGLAGCAGPAPTAMIAVAPGEQVRPAVAVVVRVAGGGRTLSPREFANIHQAIGGQLDAAGYTFARNADVADFLVTVRFTPNPLSPDGGHVAITGVEPNPMKRRRSAAANESPPTNELTKTLQDMERWVDSQAATSS